MIQNVYDSLSSSSATSTTANSTQNSNKFCIEKAKNSLRTLAKNCNEFGVGDDLASFDTNSNKQNSKNIANQEEDKNRHKPSVKSRIPTSIQQRRKSGREEAPELATVFRSDLIENSKNFSQSAFKFYTNSSDTKSGSKSSRNASNNGTQLAASSAINNGTKASKNGRLRSSAGMNSPPQDKTYNLDSDESMAIDDLLSNPQKLKEKMKQSKLNREQLIQLQEDYLKLLEQYAQAENFIDNFRLTGHQLLMNGGDGGDDASGKLGATPSDTKMFQERENTNSEINADIYKQLNSKLQNINLNQNVSNNNSILIELNNNNNNNNQQETDPINSPSSSNNSSTSTSNLSNQSLKNSSQKNTPLIVVSTKTSRENSGLTLEEEAASIIQNISENDDQEIVIDPASKLGILVQTKVLEDKMNACLTLLNENQLNELEQKQVYSNLKEEFDLLAQNYRKTMLEQQSSEIVINELDVAVDLNQELKRMRSIFGQILNRINEQILADNRNNFDPMTVSTQMKLSDRSSNVSSFESPDELVDQYYNQDVQEIDLNHAEKPKQELSNYALDAKHSPLFDKKSSEIINKARKVLANQLLKTSKADRIASPQLVQRKMQASVQTSFNEEFSSDQNQYLVSSEFIAVGHTKPSREAAASAMKESKQKINRSCQTSQLASASTQTESLDANKNRILIRPKKELHKESSDESPLHDEHLRTKTNLKRSNSIDVLNSTSGIVKPFDSKQQHCIGSFQRIMFESESLSEEEKIIQTKNRKKHEIVRQLDKEVELLKQKILKQNLEKSKRKSSLTCLSSCNEFEQSKPRAESYNCFSEEHLDSSIESIDSISNRKHQSRNQETRCVKNSKTKSSKSGKEKERLNEFRSKSLSFASNLNSHQNNTNNNNNKNKSDSGVSKRKEGRQSEPFSGCFAHSEMNLNDYMSNKIEQNYQLNGYDGNGDYSSKKRRANSRLNCGSSSRGDFFADACSGQHVTSPIIYSSNSKPPKRPSTSCNNHKVSKNFFVDQQLISNKLLKKEFTSKKHDKLKSNSNETPNRFQHSQQLRSTSATPFHNRIYSPLNEFDQNTMSQKVNSMNENVHRPFVCSHQQKQASKTASNSMYFAQPVQNNHSNGNKLLRSSSASRLNQEKKPKKVRYYIREYSDDVSAMCDHELAHRNSMSSCSSASSTATETPLSSQSSTPSSYTSALTDDSSSNASNLYHFGVESAPTSSSSSSHNNNYIYQQTNSNLNTNIYSSIDLTNTTTSGVESVSEMAHHEPEYKKIKLIHAHSNKQNVDSRLDSFLAGKKLEERIGSILSCTVCLDLPQAAIYQCTNGHLMCAGCFSHLLADARLKDEQATCPNCRCEISKSLCSRNLAVEKTLCELPANCVYCEVLYPRNRIDFHQTHECHERATKCAYARIGCTWEGPFHELDSHTKHCMHPNRPGREILLYLNEKDGEKSEEHQCSMQLISSLSFEKVSFNDLQFKQYKTDDLTPKLYFETNRFNAFFHQWVLKARVNDNEKNPNLSLNRHISYQLILKSKLSSSQSSSFEVKFCVLKGPFGEVPIRPCVHTFEFSSSKLETDFIKFNISSSDCNKLLGSKTINFRFFMFQP